MALLDQFFFFLGRKIEQISTEKEKKKVFFLQAK